MLEKEDIICESLSYMDDEEFLTDLVYDCTSSFNSYIDVINKMIKLVPPEHKDLIKL